MKKVIGIALVLLLGCSMMAFADANSWLVTAKAADQNGSNYTETLIGWTDGFTNGADTDMGEFTEPNGPLPASDMVTVVSWLDANSGSIMDFRTPLASDGTDKVFYLSTYYQRDAATPASAYTTAINVTLTQAADYAFPYLYGGKEYMMVLDYKDALGALQTVSFTNASQLNEFTWQARVKAEKSLSDWDAKLTVKEVPEPGSMLALGSGLVGLMGFALRRRS